MKLRSAAISSAALLLLLALAQPAAALETVTIRSCYDGDTCRTTDGERIRLACIDTPELKGKRAQPQRARAARDHLRAMVVGSSVGLRRITTDRYGRTVGELFVDGMNVQQAMVASRHAEIYSILQLGAYPWGVVCRRPGIGPEMTGINAGSN